MQVHTICFKDPIISSNLVFLLKMKEGNSEGHVECVHTIKFEIGFLKLDCVNRPEDPSHLNLLSFKNANFARTYLFMLLPVFSISFCILLFNSVKFLYIIIIYMM